MKKIITIRIVSISLLIAIVGIIGAPAVPVFAASTEVEYGYSRLIQSNNGNDYPESYSVATDADENVYLSGWFEGTLDFDPTSGVDSKTSIPGALYIQKLTSDGNYVRTTVLEASSSITPYTLVTDSQSNFYIAVKFSGTLDLDPGAGVEEVTGSNTMVIVKFNSDGVYQDAYVYSGTGSITFTDLYIAADDSMYFLGRLNGQIDLDHTSGTNSVTSTSGFMLKVNADGTFAWANTLSTNIYSGAIAGFNDIVYTSGIFVNTADFDPGAGTDNKVAAVNNSLFVAAFSADTGAYQSVQVVGNANYELAYDLEFDSDGNLFEIGYYNGSLDFDPGAGVDTKATGGDSTRHTYLRKFDSNGNYVSTVTWRSNGPFSVSTDVLGNVYVYSSFGDSVDVDPSGAVDTRVSLYNDMLISKFSNDLTYIAAYNTATNGDQSAYIDAYEPMSVSRGGDIFYAGNFYGTFDLDPTGGTDTFTTIEQETFLTKIDQTFYQQITGLDPALAAKTLSDVDATDNAIVNGTATTIRLSATDNTPLADVTTTFAADLDWSTVTAESNPTTGKAFVHNLTAADGTAGTYTLYVPKLAGQTRVGICPGASSLAALTDTCTDFYYLTEGVDNNLTTATIDSQDYWAISGLTGTGGFSAEAAATSSGSDSQALAETGESQTLILTMSIVFLCGALTGFKRRSL